MKSKAEELAEQYQNKGCIEHQLIIENARTRWAKQDFLAGYAARDSEVQLLDGLNIHQWKAKFQNANMDKAEALFKERELTAKLDAAVKVVEKVYEIDSGWAKQGMSNGTKNICEKFLKELKGE